jgi:hypothetical protein
LRAAVFRLIPAHRLALAFPALGRPGGVDQRQVLQHVGADGAERQRFPVELPPRECDRIDGVEYITHPTNDRPAPQ